MSEVENAVSLPMLDRLTKWLYVSDTTQESSADKWTLQRLLMASEKDAEQHTKLMLEFTNTLPSLEILEKAFHILEKEGCVEMPCVQISLVENVEKYCKYAGFIEFKVITAQGSVPTKFVAWKPIWNVGATHEIDYYIDDGSVLSGDFVYQQLGQGKESCAEKATACANCTCGRAELEATLGAEEARRRMENSNVKSSCGKCYLGDAYRCAGCPYKGQPAFKPGDKVRLNETVSELQAPQAENAASVGSDGKVKLTMA